MPIDTDTAIQRVTRVVESIFEKPEVNSKRMRLHDSLIGCGLDILATAEEGLTDEMLIIKLKKDIIFFTSEGITKKKEVRFDREDLGEDEDSSNLMETEENTEKEIEGVRDSLQKILSEYEFDAFKQKTDEHFKSQKLNGFSPLGIHILFRRARVRLKLSGYL